jgi:hypothetical protein
MADANPNRLGQANGAGDVEANFLEMFSGEVLVAFERKNKFANRVTTKTVSSGKSWQFPATGKTAAVYHTPGAQLLGQDSVLQNKITIPIDKKLITHEFIADIDEAINHYDSRSIYAKEMGNALAVAMDKHILVEAALGARASATVTGENGGTTVTDANLNSATDTDRATAWIDSLYTAAETLDDNDAPEEGRWCALPNQDYYILVKTVQTSGFSAINADYGARGSFADGTVFNIAGIELVKTNNLSTTDISSPAANSLFDEHNGNFSETAGIVGCQNAVGVVKLMDLSVQQEYDITRQGTLLVASYALGMKYLRPECLIEFDHTV